MPIDEGVKLVPDLEVEVPELVAESKPTKERKEKKKKKETKNPVQFTPVKKTLVKYTVSGNVNSRGTKYRVTEIIEAQDKDTATSIFKERAKKNLGGIRNITKVVIDEFKDGDVASKEEIVENLPQSVEVKLNTEPIKDFISKIKTSGSFLVKETLKRILENKDLKVLSFRLEKADGKEIITSYRIVEVEFLDSLASHFSMVKSKFSDLNHKESSVIISALVKNELPEMVEIKNKTKNSVLKISELMLDEDEEISYEEASDILKVVPTLHTSTQHIIYGITTEIAKELGIDFEVSKLWEK